MASKYMQTELGTEKQCIHCEEYYPATKEFFYGTGRIKRNGQDCLEANCKDCYKQRYKPWVKRTYEISYRYAEAN